jgi:hypothetical protein
LAIASIADEILRKYGDAYNIDYDLTDLSNMAMAMTNIASMSAHGREGHSVSLGNIGNELVLANIEDYQSAKALSLESIKIFVAIPKPADQVDDHNSNRIIVSVSRIENGLIELNNLLNYKASPQDLMKIVHVHIHPSLQLAYNLESKIK